MLHHRHADWSTSGRGKPLKCIYLCTNESECFCRAWLCKHHPCFRRCRFLSECWGFCIREQLAVCVQWGVAEWPGWAGFLLSSSVCQIISQQCFSQVRTGCLAAIKLSSPLFRLLHSIPLKTHLIQSHFCSQGANTLFTTHGNNFHMCNS